jgi:putative hemolysin
MSHWIAVLVGLFLLAAVLSAFFAASETALVALSRIDLQRLRERGHRSAGTIEALKKSPTRLLSTALIGQNLCTAGASAVATVIAENALGEKVGIPVAVVATTLFLFTFGEMAPKSLAAASPSRVAVAVARPFRFFSRVMGPFAAIAIFLVTKSLAFFGIRETNPAMTEEEMKAVINIGHAEGVIASEEREQMVRVMEFGERTVSEVMVPRPRITAIEENTRFPEVRQLFSANKLSRVPVYRGTLDNVIGVLNAKDLFDVTDEQEASFTPGRYMTPPFLVPEFKKLDQLFREMRRRRQHMAIALDEYGGTAGLITIEDAIEALLGAIQDEYDEETPGFVKIGDRTYLLDGAFRLSEVESRFGLRYPGIDAETVAGLLLHRFGRIPKNGDRWRGRQAEYVVIDATPSAITKVKMILPRKAEVGKQHA